MDKSNEVTTPATPTEYEESFTFEYVPRKRKSKKSRSNRNKKYLDDTNKPELNEANEDSAAPLTSCVVTIQDENENSILTSCDENDNTNERVSWDSQISAPPETSEHSESVVYSTIEKEKLSDENSLLPLPEDKNIFNSKSLPKDSNTYQLENFEKNILFIFKQQTIKSFKPNVSVDRDEAELKSTFSKFGFESIVENDLTKEELMNKLRTYGDQDFTDYGCVAVAILTYGSKHGLIWAKDEIYSELELIKYFKVDKRPTLVTKPKIFIIQACVGEVETKAVAFRSTAGSIRKDIHEVKEPYTLPAESDMLILHNSYTGNQSQRSDIYGSWFIQTLCSKINQLAATYDLEGILTEVKRDVTPMEYKEDFSDKINKDKLKMPVTTSTLIRKLYLKSFGEQAHISLSVPDYADGGDELSLVTTENSVLDSTPFKTPLELRHREICTCLLEHFEYMKECLKSYLVDHSEDMIAQSFYDVAITLKEEDEFHNAKETLLHTISKYLSAETEESHLYKYLHVYNKRF